MELPALKLLYTLACCFQVAAIINDFCILYKINKMEAATDCYYCVNKSKQSQPHFKDNRVIVTSSQITQASH